MATEKKIALVTGANRGIGLETARQLGQQGVTVVVAARTLKSAEETAAKLKKDGIEVIPVQLDVTKPSRIAWRRQVHRRQVRQARHPHQQRRHRRAGRHVCADRIETTEEELQTVFGTNVFSVIAVTRAFLPLLKKSDAGRIVNLSSILGSLTLHADPKSPIASVKSPCL